MAMTLCSMVFLLLPVIFLLSLSFFVLVVLSNVKTHTLKVFGYVIVALIWLTTILVFTGGIYKTSKGMYPGMFMKRAMMKHPMMGVPQREGSSEGMMCPKMRQK